MFTRSTSIPRPKISVATKIRFSNALNAEYRAILGREDEALKVSLVHNSVDLPLLLLQSRMDTDTWEVARHQQFVKFDGSGDGLDKNYNLGLTISTDHVTNELQILG